MTNWKLKFGLTSFSNSFLKMKQLTCLKFLLLIFADCKLFHSVLRLFFLIIFSLFSMLHQNWWWSPWLITDEFPAKLINSFYQTKIQGTLYLLLSALLFFRWKFHQVLLAAKDTYNAESPRFQASSDLITNYELTLFSAFVRTDSYIDWEQCFNFDWNYKFILGLAIFSLNHNGFPAWRKHQF